MRGQVSDCVRFPQGDFAACGRRVTFWTGELSSQVQRFVKEYFKGGFPRLLTAAYFAHGGKVTKTPPGTAQDGHFVSIFAFPRTPLRGTHTCERKQNFRRAKSEWHSKLPPGHWALASPKLHSVRFNFCA